ncbi:MAG: LPS translocon maturation chaperone LptM [Betaproteobacteria bacterium]
MRFFLLGAVLVVFAAGCGQKGPLYLRDSPPPGVKPFKPKPAEPVPYPSREEGAEAR